MNQVLLPYGVSQEEQTPNLIRSFCFPMILTEKQKNQLHKVLDLGHEIRERAVEQRIADREKNRPLKQAGEKPAYLNLIEQRKLISAWMKSEPRFSLIHSQVAQDLCARVDKADKQWLKGFKTGDKRAKPARHQDRKFFRSITYPQYGNGARLSAGRVWFSKLGTFRLHDYQKITGTKKTVSIVWKQGKFWAVFTAEQAAKDWFPSTKQWADKPTVAGDFGLKSLLTLSDGVVFDPPRRLREAFQKLRTIQKSVSRKLEARKAAWEAEKALLKMQEKTISPLREYPRSARLVADIRRLAKAHTKVERCRGHDHAKIASVLDSEYSRVALEDHGAQFMIRNRRLAKSASDRALCSLKSRIKSTLSADRLLMVSTTDANGGGNSQTCTCGATVPKDLKDRVHTCPSCGRVGDRDVVAADRAHVRAFGVLTQVRGQRICERGEHESEGVDRHLGESVSQENGFGMFVEAQTSQASLARENTEGGKPTSEDKTGLVQPESKTLTP
ncbi:RNA-guided endonuclease InsQ/TnpB family protein [Pseudomonas putida]|uniref:Transposase n=1 Tax=Pseudomonas putida TaxID=303 RepID=A0A8I1EFL2_PSEPU|nr:RNA-guided endonuclease TnpB family protein [Pseudomonas putida]MBI6885765.1 transposase [Pseudomonas putida]